MKLLAHPGPHDRKKLHALPSGLPFVLILGTLVTLFLLLFVSVEAR